MPLRDDKAIAPSDRELDILKVFWEIGEASVRDVHTRMSSDGEFAFTTIQTLIRIMAGKGLLTQRRDNRTLYYTSRYTTEQASSRFWHKLLDGSVDQLVMNILRAENLSIAELKRLETLIAKSRKRKLMQNAE